MRGNYHPHAYNQNYNRQAYNPKQSIILNQMQEAPSVFKGKTKFFILKSNSAENIDVSMKHEVWATTQRPSKLLVQHFQHCDNIILLFSVNESFCFQGVGRMETVPNKNYKADIFQQMNQNQSKNNKMMQLSLFANFKVQWLLQCQYPFRELDHLPGNPLNDYQPIYKSFNGQELSYEIGNYFCHLLFNQADKRQYNIDVLKDPQELKSINKYKGQKQYQKRYGNQKHYN